MKFFLTSPTFIRGTPAGAGKVVEVTESEAHVLRECKRGEPFDPIRHGVNKASSPEAKAAVGK